MAINQRKAGSILSYVQIFLTNTVGIIYTPIMLRLLSQDEYGLFGTAASLTTYLSLLSFGVTGAYMKFIMEARVVNDKEEEKRINGMFITIFAFFSALVIIIGAILIFASEFIFGAKYDIHQLYEIKWIMFLTIINYVFTFLFTPVTMYIQSHERYVFIRVVYIILNCLTPVINIIVLNYYPYAVALSVVSLSTAVITFGIWFWYAYKRLNMRFIFTGFKFEKVKSIFIFSSFLLLNDITTQIVSSTDRLVLSVVAGAGSVAIYTVGAHFGTYFISFSTSVSSVFSPTVNRIIVESKIKNENPNKALNELFLKVGRVQFLILSLIMIGYITIGQQFINLWAGKDYHYAYWIGLLLLLSNYIPSFQNIGLEIQKAKNMHKKRSIIYFFVGVLNVLLTIPLAIYFSSEQYDKGIGGIASAFATLLSIILGQVIWMNIYYHKKIGLNIIDFWKGIIRLLPSMILPTLTGVLLNYFIVIDSYKVFFFDVLVILVVYLISVWFFGMNSYEKDLVKAPVKRIIHRFKNNGVV